jgi:putative acetyltransferase
MGIEIRQEASADHASIREVVGAAFESEPVVAHIVERIRASDGYVPSLSLVACEEGEVVGHVMLSRAEVEADAKARHEVLILSPLAVKPDRQRQGIGEALVWAVVALADERREPVVVLQGSPAYYPRFGFRESRTLGITMDLPD